MATGWVINNKHVDASTYLAYRIMLLKSIKEQQEELLQMDLKELYYSLHLSTIIKDTVRDLGADPEFKTSLLQQAIGIGGNYLVDRITLRKGSIKGYLVNMGLKKLLSFFVSNNKEKIAEKLHIV